MKWNREHGRRGVIVPLAAILMVVIVGMVAFAVDIGWIAVTQSELQNTADAAALAGVGPLMDGYVNYTLPNLSTSQKSTILTNALASARTKAKEYAAYNSAGGVNALVLNDSDIEFGYLDSNNNYSTSYSGFPNTIKATMRRDGQANGALNLFFGPALGTTQTSLTATASATMYTGTINSFSGAAGMMPFTFDVNHWNNFLKTGQDSSGNTSVASDGTPQLKVYATNKDTGNFGELSLNDSHNGASTTTNWIHNGVSSSDVQALINNQLIPLSEHNANSWDWNGNPGFKASNVMAVNTHVGLTYTLPLFTPKNSSPSNYQAGVGKGSNYDYNIVAFVGVRIMYTADSNREIIVQPAAVIEPNAVMTGVAPAGTSSSLTTTFTTPKLTR